jgi:hypothetical protein
VNLLKSPRTLPVEGRAKNRCYVRSLGGPRLANPPSAAEHSGSLEACPRAAAANRWAVAGKNVPRSGAAGRRLRGGPRASSGRRRPGRPPAACPSPPQHQICEGWHRRPRTQRLGALLDCEGGELDREHDREQPHERKPRTCLKAVPAPSDEPGKRQHGQAHNQGGSQSGRESSGQRREVGVDPGALHAPGSWTIPCLVRKDVTEW